ncbi:MAG: hypothetical protein ACK5N0_07955 [Synechococcaceae cyanobacterium]
MTITELLIASGLVLAAASTSLRLNAAATSALAAAERRLQDVDRLDAELVLVEQQLRDLAATLPPPSGAGAAPIDACAMRARELLPRLATSPAPAGLTRQVADRSGPGGLLAVELRSEATDLTRQRIYSLAAMGLCGGDHGTP